MDKNTIAGLVLIGAILFGFSWWNSRNAAEEQAILQAEQAKTDSIALVNQLKQQAEYQQVLKEQGTLNDSAKIARERAENVGQIGEYMANALDGKEEFYTVETEKMIIKFTNKGGRIHSVELKEYKAYGKNPLILFDGPDNDFSLSFYTNREITTSSFFFSPQQVASNKVLQKDETLLVPFRLYTNENSYIEFAYTILNDTYKVDCNVNMIGMNNIISQQVTNLDLTWRVSTYQQEKGFDSENNYSTIVYKYPNDESIEELSISKESEEKKIVSKVEWINFKQHFFSTILVTNGSTDNILRYDTYQPNNPDKLLKRNEAKMQLAYDSKKTEQTIPLEFYFVPNHFQTLKSYHLSFEKVIPLGGWIIGIINRGIVIPVFNVLKEHIASFGIIILILTLIIKLVMSPLTWKSYLSTAKMKVLKPELDKLNEKYPNKDDAMKKQQETMALYKRTGVNMFGGCLPMLLQLPVLYAMFRFFPSSIELRQESFLWADDLSAYDSILNLPFTIPFYGDHVSLFTLLMAVSIFISTKISMSQQPTNAQFAGMNTMMLYVMPVMMLFFLNNFSSGLTYYYFLSNVITIGQTFIIRKFFVNEEKLLKQMNDRASKQDAQSSKKPKKKGFLERMEEKARDQQKQQQQQQQRTAQEAKKKKK